MTKKAFLAVTLVFFVLVSTGCWNRREVERLAFVRAVAVDKAEEPEKVLLTVQIAVPSQIAGGGGSQSSGGQQQPANWVIRSSGQSVFDAVRKFLTQSPRRLNWSHNRVIIFGEEFARDGVKEALDFFDRDGETRRTAWVLVAKGARGEEVMNATVPIENLTSNAIVGMIEQTRAATSFGHHLNLHQFFQRLSAPGWHPHASRIEVFTESGAPQRTLPQSPEPGRHLRLSGVGVFKQDRLIGWLGQRASRGLAIVHNQAQSSIVMIPCDGGGSQIGVEVIRSIAELKPEVIEGRLVGVITVETEGNIGDRDCPVRPSMDALNSRYATAIKNDVEALLQSLQLEFQTDVLGLGLAVWRAMPDLWKEVEGRWNEIFPTVPITVKVKADLRRTGVVTKPVLIR